MTNDVLVVVGAGGMGAAIAQRLGSGRTVVLADANEQRLDAAVDGLAADGHDVRGVSVDVTSRSSVAELASLAATLGPVTGIVHTAGVSPEQATVEVVLQVDLLGTALVLDEFGHVVHAGGAGVVIASMAGHLHPAMDPTVERGLATSAADDLLRMPACEPGRFRNAQEAYAFAKRANHLRVAGAATSWGRRRARINSVSPGIVSTSMGRQELDGESGAVIASMIETSPCGRIGTPGDVAAAVDFLMSPAAGLITGTDLVVDGGVTAAVRSGTLT